MGSYPCSRARSSRASDVRNRSPAAYAALSHYLVRGHREQAEAARALLQSATAEKPAYACREVVVELVWVLERAHGCSPGPDCNGPGRAWGDRGPRRRSCRRCRAGGIPPPVGRGGHFRSDGACGGAACGRPASPYARSAGCAAGGRRAVGLTGAAVQPAIRPEAPPTSRGPMSTCNAPIHPEDKRGSPGSTGRVPKCLSESARSGHGRVATTARRLPSAFARWGFFAASPPVH